MKLECPYHKRRSAYDVAMIDTTACDPSMCKSCGWNPAVDKVRKARIKNLEMNNNVRKIVLTFADGEYPFYTRYLKLRGGV